MEVQLGTPPLLPSPARENRSPILAAPTPPVGVYRPEACGPGEGPALVPGAVSYSLFGVAASPLGPSGYESLLSIGWSPRNVENKNDRKQQETRTTKSYGK